MSNFARRRGRKITEDDEHESSTSSAESRARSLSKVRRRKKRKERQAEKTLSESESPVEDCISSRGRETTIDLVSDDEQKKEKSPEKADESESSLSSTDAEKEIPPDTNTITRKYQLKKADLLDAERDELLNRATYEKKQGRKKERKQRKMSRERETVKRRTMHSRSPLGKRSRHELLSDQPSTSRRMNVTGNYTSNIQSRATMHQRAKEYRSAALTSVFKATSTPKRFARKRTTPLSAASSDGNLDYDSPVAIDVSPIDKDPAIDYMMERNYDDEDDTIAGTTAGTTMNTTANKSTNKRPRKKRREVKEDDVLFGDLLSNSDPAAYLVDSMGRNSITHLGKYLNEKLSYTRSEAKPLYWLIERNMNHSADHVLACSHYMDKHYPVCYEVAKEPKMLHFSEALKKCSTKQKRSHFQAFWWPKLEHRMLEKYPYSQSIKPVFYVMLDEELVRQHLYVDLPAVNSFGRQLKQLIINNSSRRTDDSIIRDVSYYTRESFLYKTTFSLRYTTSLEVPSVYMPPTLKCGYFPKSCDTPQEMKAYLRNRYIEAVNDYQYLTKKSVIPTNKKFKMGLISDYELIKWHIQGRHIHGFFIVWEKIDEFFIDHNGKHLKKRYLVDIYNQFLFPLYIDFNRWDLRLRVTYDKVVSYNLNLAEFLRVNQPVIQNMDPKLSQPYIVHTLSEIVFGENDPSKSTPLNPIHPYVPCEFLRNSVKMANRVSLVPHLVINGTTKQMEEHANGPLNIAWANNRKAIGTIIMEQDCGNSILKLHNPIESVAIRAELDSEKTVMYLNFVENYQTQKETCEWLEKENRARNLDNVDKKRRYNRESMENKEMLCDAIKALSDRKEKMKRVLKKRQQLLDEQFEKEKQLMAEKEREKERERQANEEAAAALAKKIEEEKKKKLLEEIEAARLLTPKNANITLNGTVISKKKIKCMWRGKCLMRKPGKNLTKKEKREQKKIQMKYKKDQAKKRKGKSKLTFEWMRSRSKSMNLASRKYMKRFRKTWRPKVWKKSKKYTLYDLYCKKKTTPAFVREKFRATSFYELTKDYTAHFESIECFLVDFDRSLLEGYFDEVRDGRSCLIDATGLYINLLKCFKFDYKWSFEYNADEIFTNYEDIKECVTNDLERLFDARNNICRNNQLFELKQLFMAHQIEYGRSWENVRGEHCIGEWRFMKNSFDYQSKQPFEWWTDFKEEYIIDLDAMMTVETCNAVTTLLSLVRYLSGRDVNASLRNNETIYLQSKAFYPRTSDEAFGTGNVVLKMDDNANHAQYQFVTSTKFAQAIMDGLACVSPNDERITKVHICEMKPTIETVEQYQDDLIWRSVSYGIVENHPENIRCYYGNVPDNVHGLIDVLNNMKLMDQLKKLHSGTVIFESSTREQCDNTIINHNELLENAIPFQTVDYTWFAEKNWFVWYENGMKVKHALSFYFDFVNESHPFISDLEKRIVILKYEHEWFNGRKDGNPDGNKPVFLVYECCCEAAVGSPLICYSNINHDKEAIKLEGRFVCYHGPSNCLQIVGINSNTADTAKDPLRKTSKTGLSAMNQEDFYRKSYEFIEKLANIGVTHESSVWNWIENQLSDHSLFIPPPLLAIQHIPTENYSQNEMQMEQDSQNTFQHQASKRRHPDGGNCDTSVPPKMQRMLPELDLQNIPISDEDAWQENSNAPGILCEFGAIDRRIPSPCGMLIEKSIIACNRFRQRISKRGYRSKSLIDVDCDRTTLSIHRSSSSISLANLENLAHKKIEKLRIELKNNTYHTETTIEQLKDNSNQHISNIDEFIDPRKVIANNFPEATKYNIVKMLLGKEYNKKSISNQLNSSERKLLNAMVESNEKAALCRLEGSKRHIPPISPDEVIENTSVSKSIDLIIKFENDKKSDLDYIEKQMSLIKGLQRRSRKLLWPFFQVSEKIFRMNAAIYEQLVNKLATQIFNFKSVYMSEANSNDEILPNQVENIREKLIEIRDVWFNLKPVERQLNALQNLLITKPPDQVTNTIKSMCIDMIQRIRFPSFMEDSFMRKYFWCTHNPVIGASVDIFRSSTRKFQEGFAQQDQKVHEETTVRDEVPNHDIHAGKKNDLLFGIYSTQNMDLYSNIEASKLFKVDYRMKSYYDSFYLHRLLQIMTRQQRLTERDIEIMDLESKAILIASIASQPEKRYSHHLIAVEIEKQYRQLCQNFDTNVSSFVHPSGYNVIFSYTTDHEISVVIVKEFTNFVYDANKTTRQCQCNEYCFLNKMDKTVALLTHGRYHILERIFTDDCVFEFNDEMFKTFNNYLHQTEILEDTDTNDDNDDEIDDEDSKYTSMSSQIETEKSNDVIWRINITTRSLNSSKFKKSKPRRIDFDQPETSESRPIPISQMTPQSSKIRYIRTTKQLLL